MERHGVGVYYVLAVRMSRKDKRDANDLLTSQSLVPFLAIRIHGSLNACLHSDITHIEFHTYERSIASSFWQCPRLPWEKRYLMGVVLCNINNIEGVCCMTVMLRIT